MKKLDPRTYARARVLYNESVRVLKEIESLARMVPRASEQLALHRSVHATVLEIVGLVKQLQAEEVITQPTQKAIDRMIEAQAKSVKSSEELAHMTWRNVVEYELRGVDGPGQFDDL